MHVVTIMNYDDPLGVTMCRTWFYLIERFNPGIRITVFHAGKIEKIEPFGRQFPNIEFVPLDLTGVPTQQVTGGFGVPSQELILAMWRHFDRNPGFGKHLYVEADAWVLTSLLPLWALIDQKPYISFQELLDKDGLPLINTGVHSYCSSDGFVTYDVLIDQLRRDGGVIKIPVGEQGLVNAYFRRIGYDCRHAQAGFEWNCWAARSITEKADDQEIVVWSGDYGEPERWPNVHPWSWWGQKRRVKILHAFMAKFWQLSECLPLWNYCDSKVGAA